MKITQIREKDGVEALSVLDFNLLIEKIKTEVIPKKAHTYGEWKVVKEATETEEGLKSHSCTVCGAEETASIPKKGSTGGIEIRCK